MNIKHEFTKINKIAYREGIFYGYEYLTEDSYLIQKLDPDYCRITGFEDGVYNFAFDFSYFNQNESLLEDYAQEFKDKYRDYKNAKEDKKIKRKDLPKYQFQELSSEHSICIKTDETIVYPFPPFVGVIPDIYEIQDYKALKKASQEMQNIAILIGSIPYLKEKDTANNFALELNTAIEFGNRINQELPDQFGFLLSVYDKMELFKLKDETVGTDKVEEAVSNFWETTGTTKSLFGGDATTDAAIKRAVATDEENIFSLLLQIERWINRKLKSFSGDYKFKINILRTTIFNQGDVVNRELKLAQFGLVNKIKLAVASGLSQSSVSSMAFLENEVLKIHENWIPLSSTHTQNGDVNSPTNGEKGKPTIEQKEQSGGDDD